MINVSIKQLDRICLLIVVSVALACGFLILRDVAHKTRLFETEKSILSGKMKEIDLAATNLIALNINLTDIKRELTILNERIPETGKIGLLLQQIDGLMRQHKVTLISLEPLAVSQDKIYLKNPIKLLFKGRYVDIFHLLREIESLNRIMLMENISISKDGISDQCQVELLITVFERPKAI